MEIDVERHERILAPVQLVWDEIDSLERILPKTPHVTSYDIVPGGRRATGTSKVAWGPIQWTIALEIAVESLQPREQIGFRVVAPSYDMSVDATIELKVVGEAETRLDYRGHVEVRHRMANRMRGMFNEMVEEHMHGLVSRVKVKAEQRRLAQERLLS